MWYCLVFSCAIHIRMHSIGFGIDTMWDLIKRYWPPILLTIIIIELAWLSFLLEFWINQ